MLKNEIVYFFKRPFQTAVLSHIVFFVFFKNCKCFQVFNLHAAEITKLSHPQPLQSCFWGQPKPLRELMDLSFEGCWLNLIFYMLDSKVYSIEYEKLELDGWKCPTNHGRLWRGNAPTINRVRGSSVLSERKNCGAHIVQFVEGSMRSCGLHSLLTGFWFCSGQNCARLEIRLRMKWIQINRRLCSTMCVCALHAAPQCIVWI